MNGCSDSLLDFFAPAARGLEELLAAELAGLGAEDVSAVRAGVSFRASLEVAYRACLWSRLASRVLMPLAAFPAGSPEELYEGMRTVAWDEHLTPTGTLAVDAGVGDSHLTHSRFAAQKAKDAVVDQFREAHGVRPSVDVHRPDLRINLHVARDQAIVSLDLSGESLHRRGYRQEGVQVEAPLKETVAAAVLLRAGWPEIAAAGGPLVDPLCGSGTLPIEAGLMAGDVAPGLTREHFGFLGWRGHQPDLWARVRMEAEKRRDEGLARLPALYGFDSDGRSVGIAQANARRAGLSGRILFERRELSVLEAPPSAAEGRSLGLVVANPPYGARLGDVQKLEPLYVELGARLKTGFQGWSAAVLTGNPDLGHRLGLRPSRVNTLFNGSIECRLLRFRLDAERFGTPCTPRPRSPGAEAFANRLTKNLRHLGRWARKQGITCYRLYDSDLPDFALAVDVYEQFVHVQEHEAPATIDPALARTRLREALEVIPSVLDLPRDHVHLKIRRRQRGASQYQRLDQTAGFHQVSEGGLRFLVNLTDYLDTGLFLDHRLIRAAIRDLAEGRHFLNLFGYTGVATVYAAAGGATATTTVDLSHVYLEWAGRNFALNGLPVERHSIVQADCLEWIAAARGRYGLIFLDPPTFSNSKRMGEVTLDIQRDHVALIRAAAALLDEDGVLLFSCNYRRFKPDLEALEAGGLDVADITASTLPQDFARNPRIHSCYRVTRTPGRRRVSAARRPPDGEGGR